MTAEQVAERLGAIRDRIAQAGADPSAVEVVAVTKGFDVDVARAARAAGLVHLGENYAAELVTKAAAIPGACWHFLGPLQRNKAARLAPLVDVWEAVDRLAAVDAIAKRAPGATVLVQVNLTGEPAKAGCTPDQVEPLVGAGMERGLDVQGLMTVGPAGDLEGARACFKELANMARGLGLRALSMGMSDDFDIAVSEGATSIRLGRALFGPRPTTSTLQR